MYKNIALVKNGIVFGCTFVSQVTLLGLFWKRAEKVANAMQCNSTQANAELGLTKNVVLLTDSPTYSYVCKCFEKWLPIVMKQQFCYQENTFIYC